MTGERGPLAPFWRDPRLTYRYNDLAITFPYVGLLSTGQAVHRCGICAAGVGLTLDDVKRTNQARDGTH